MSRRRDETAQREHRDRVRRAITEHFPDLTDPTGGHCYFLQVAIGNVWERSESGTATRRAVLAERDRLMIEDGQWLRHREMPSDRWTGKPIALDDATRERCVAALDAALARDAATRAAIDNDARSAA